MSEKNNDRFKLDLYSLVMDYLRNLYVIILGALAAVLIMDLYMTMGVQKTYSTKATFVVTSKSYSTNVYRNLNAAQNMAKTLTNVLNSDILKKEVCKDIGIETFDASVRASVISETNLLELRVTSATPLRTYQIIKSIMKNYRGLISYVNDATIMQVLEKPSVPTSPSSGVRNTRRLRQIFIIAFGALSLLFLYLSYRNDTVKSEEDLGDKIDGRNLGTIEHEKKKLFSKKKHAPLVNNVEVSFSFVEENKKVATRLVTYANEADAKAIMVTSVKEHEGKSSVSANIAITLAKQSYKVLLIDCDLRRPTQYKLFEVEEAPGLPAAINREVAFRDAIIHKDGLDLLLTTERHSNSTEIVSGDAMREFLRKARAKYNFIIIDTPPMGVMSDAEAIANIADMSLLVVQYNNVLAADINDAIDTLSRASAEFGGTILNDLRVLSGASAASRGYGGYGGYGRYGRYGHYGNYGRYGKYGRYGRYGHYAERKAASSEVKS